MQLQIYSVFASNPVIEMDKTLKVLMHGILCKIWHYTVCREGVYQKWHNSVRQGSPRPWRQQRHC